MKPALSASYTLASSSEVYGKISAVGERTYGSVPADFGQDVSSFGPEDLSIGWRSGNAFEGLGENALDVVVGRTQYQLGHGFLLYDGAAEGGSRGGYWTNARKAFELAAIGRFKPGAHTVEAFYLDKDELEENDTGSRLWGANYEYAIGEHTTLGATYMKWFADAALEPGTRRVERLQRPRLHGAAQRHPRPVVRVRVRVGAERRGARLERVDRPGLGTN